MEELELKQKLITLSRILNKEGLFDMFGHVSVRLPEKALFFITPALGMDRAHHKVEEILKMDFEGNKIDGEGVVPLEQVMHSALHQARQDAVCVIHLHPYHITTLSVAGIKFVPTTIHEGDFREGVPVYDRAELIITKEQGQKLVSTAGSAKAVILRGHGIIVIGESLEEALFLTLRLEEGAKRLIDVSSVGTPIPLTKEELDIDKKRGSGRPGRDYVYGRLWQYYELKTR